MARLSDRNKRINELRARQRFDDDKFDSVLDRHFDRLEKALDHPVRTVAKVVAVWVVAVLLIIAAIFVGLALVF